MIVENASFIFGFSSVICTAENCVKVCVSKHFNSIHYTLMASQDDLQVIFIHKTLNSVNTESYDVSLGYVISVDVDFRLCLIYVRNRIRPKNIIGYFLLRRDFLMIDNKGLFYFVKIGDFGEVLAYSRMNT